jgi:hypothetical protein
MVALTPFYMIHVPRYWLRLLHIGEPLIEAQWGAVYYGGSFTFQPVSGASGSLVAGTAQFPDKILSSFWCGSRREAICPRHR